MDRGHDEWEADVGGGGEEIISLGFGMTGYTQPIADIVNLPQANRQFSHLYIDINIGGGISIINHLLIYMVLLGD